MNRWVYFVLFAAVSCVFAQDPQVEGVLKRARDYLGPEQSLEAVESLIYRCRVLDRNGNKKSKMTLMLSKPENYKSINEYVGYTVTTVSNGTEGFRFRKVPKNQRLNNIEVLPYERCRFFASNALENLAFFRGPMIMGGTITFEGIGTRRGVPVNILTFTYPEGQTFTRYFARADARLISTVIEGEQSELTELGHQTVAGIRFPEEIKIFDSDGYLVQRVIFDTIEVNPEIPGETFEFPDDVFSLLNSDDYHAAD